MSLFKVVAVVLLVISSFAMLSLVLLNRELKYVRSEYEDKTFHNTHIRRNNIKLIFLSILTSIFVITFIFLSFLGY